MEFISLLNDVLGPVMRGPSSSHTAGSYHIGRIVRSLAGGPPAAVTFAFDPNGSYAKTFRQQGVDRALSAGIMGWTITDRRFPAALDLAARQRIEVRFKLAPLVNADHPNTVQIAWTSRQGKKLRARAKSIGGGMILITEFNGWSVAIDGKAHEVLVLADKKCASRVRVLLAPETDLVTVGGRQARGDLVFQAFRRPSPLSPNVISQLNAIPGVRNVWTADPIFHVRKGEPLFSTSQEMVRITKRTRRSLGRTALAYESGLLGMSEAAVLGEIQERYRIMEDAVRRGLRGRGLGMQLLRPTAGKIFRNEQKGMLPTGGVLTRAAARAMAALHVSNSMGIVCAAPTGGSAGVLPGVMTTLAEEKKLSPEKIGLALLAASAVGLIVAKRATFAAEVAGCQVEIGAAGAMAAAAVVEAADGSARQAADAAAISFQNTMGSVCDLVQGICEIPCHTRNAIAAAGAFISADMILGGYENPIPLDETIDAVYATGKLLPAELRCTALGGLALAPSALSMPRLRT